MNEVKLNDATGPTKDLGSGTEYSEWGGLYLTLKTARKWQTILFKTGTQISSKLANVLH